MIRWSLLNKCVIHMCLDAKGTSTLTSHKNIGYQSAQPYWRCFLNHLRHWPIPRLERSKEHDTSYCSHCDSSLSRCDGWSKNSMETLNMNAKRFLPRGNPSCNCRVLLELNRGSSECFLWVNQLPKWEQVKHRWQKWNILYRIKSKPYIYHCMVGVPSISFRQKKSLKSTKWRDPACSDLELKKHNNHRCSGMSE